MKKILALVLSVLMVVTAFAGLVTVSAAEADTTPVAIYHGSQLNANTNNAYCVDGTYSFASNLVRYRWFQQGGPVDPQFHLHKSEWGTLKVGPYMVIKYKTTTAGLKGGAFIGNGEIGQSFITWNYSQADGNWAQVMLYLPDMIEDYYDESNNLITHFRWEVVENAADFPDGTLDVEYVAFFDTEEDAVNFKHTDKPVDPDSAVSGSYLTYDFSTVTDLSSVARIEGHTGTYGNQTNVSLVDGALHVVATGDDPYVVLMRNGSDDLGITGTQARYMLIKYKTTATDKEMEFYTNVVGVGGWGSGPSYTNAGALTGDGNWHYIMVDASASWGTWNAALQAFRVDALASCDAGDSIDIASIKFFTTSDWVGAYIKTIADTDAAAKEMGLAYGWVTEDVEPEPEPEPDPVLLGDVTGDGKVNSKDLTRLKKYLAEGGEGATTVDAAAADMNEDGKINSKDLTRLKKQLAA